MATLWKPMTYGEELFLMLYDELGSRIKIEAPFDIGLDFLIDKNGFQEFSSQVITFEVFLRCVRCAEVFYQQQRAAPPEDFARQVRREVDLPRQIMKNSAFGERLKQVGRIVYERMRSKSLENSATKNEPSICYMCGVPLTEDNGRAHRSIEHVWPLSLGGETIEQNLLLACRDCNSKRSNLTIWAAGPVQSTYFVRSKKEPKNPSQELRFSLALARLMHAAQPTSNRKHPLTLREAARKIRPVLVDPELDFDQPYLYFELLQKLKVST